MAITSISTDWGTSPRCVRMTTTDNLSVITTAGYFATQEDEIQSINAGAWTWVAGDFIDIVYGDGQGYFTYNSTTDAFVAAPPSGGLSSTLASGRIFVGNVSNVATGVVMSGDTTVDNTGAVAIGANKVLSSMVSPLVRKYAVVSLTAAQFNGMYATPVQLVAAGGANTLVVLDRVQLLMTYVSANYAAGGVAAIQWDSTANGAGVIASTTLSAATFQAAASTGFNFNAGVVPETFTTCVNKGLYISNITGAFTTGDSTFKAHIWYTIIPTT